MVINSDKAGMYGVPAIEIDRTVRLGLSGISAGKYKDTEGKEYPINVRLPKESFKYP